MTSGFAKVSVGYRIASMPRQIEENANGALGALLRTMLYGCEVRWENTRTMLEHTRQHPDILITASDRAPVIVEAEYDPAMSVDNDAKSRLGQTPEGDPRIIESAIALRYPKEIEFAYDLDQEIANASFSYYVLYADGSRFPKSGWLTGSATDLADLISLVSVPQSTVNAAAKVLEDGIDNATRVLDEVDKLRPAATRTIARLLGMSNVTQTRRMACAIIANALVFHERLSGMHDGVKPLALVCGPEIDNPQNETLTAWNYILEEVNYWSIFAIAKDVLGQISSGDAKRILSRLRETAQRIHESGVSNAHDLTGRIFQRLIADRKYLATFYTLPASAALLAQLAVAKMKNVDWSDAEAISQLRIADFACGTGALLSAVYEQIARRHERSGGNTAKLHPIMLEKVLYGCDVMPSAIHITGSTLSGMEPSVQFQNTRLYTLAYGRQKDDSVAIGSLELLKSSAVMTLFNTSDPAMRTGSIGEETATQINTDIPDNGFDLIIMNPPFTRSTNHEGQHRNIVNPAFAAFGATTNDQSKMGDRLNQLGKQTCYHGNAGLASAFAAIADRKLKPDGILALVLPLSVAAGSSWQKFRKLLDKCYTDVSVVSIADNGHNIAFSSGTAMGDCLIIAKKTKEENGVEKKISFTSLERRPRDFLTAREIAKSMLNQSSIRGIDDGPYGGTPLTIGDETAGEMIDTPPHSKSQFGKNWGAVRLQDSSLAQTTYALSKSKLWMPGAGAVFDLAVSSLDNVGKLGLVHRLIVGPPHPAPFVKMQPSPTATYPALWNHDAKRETKMTCKPDSQLRVQQGMEKRADEIWKTASRAHINLDFRFNSQPLSVAFTEKASIGGTAWPSIIFDDARFDYAFTLWGNSTLGLLAHWWHSNLQQSGRGRTTISAVGPLTMLDFRALSHNQLEMAQQIFEDFRDKEFLPAYLADIDPNRDLLDRRVICDLLGFDENVFAAVRRLSAKWCAEPSVHGGKKRP